MRKERQGLNECDILYFNWYSLMHTVNKSIQKGDKFYAHNGFLKYSKCCCSQGLASSFVCQVVGTIVYLKEMSKKHAAL